MRKVIILALCLLVFASLAAAQTYTEGSGITGIDKLGAHQNGGRGCVGCHTPHSGARGNGGNAATGGGAVTDPDTGNFALWGQDMGPLYGQTLGFGDNGDFELVLPGSSHADEALTTGVMMCLSCHDGSLAKGAMMTNQSFEQTAGLLAGLGYGPQPIPTLLGADGTASGNYQNDHPIGPDATLGAVGVASRLLLDTTSCLSHGVAVPCLKPNPANAQYMAFISHYGAFNITQRIAGVHESGGRTTGVVIPAGATDATTAFLVCTTCHTPHTMHVYSGRVRGSATQGTYPTYFFISAPYNPGADTANGTLASSATQFCRQCHFTGAGGSNEGSNIMNIDTRF